jgi:hypothetical protein
VLGLGLVSLPLVCDIDSDFFDLSDLFGHFWMCSYVRSFICSAYNRALSVPCARRLPPAGLRGACGA